MDPRNTPEDEPFYDADENDFGTDDSDGFEFDDSDDEPTDSVEESTPSIMDLVSDGKAAEVKQQIFQSLYSKVGERLDAMKAERRASFIPPVSDEE